MSRGLQAAVVDSSALICIARIEPAATFFLVEMARTAKLYISAVTHAEVILATMSNKEAGALAAMDELFESLAIATVDFAGEDVPAYRHAARRYHLKAKPAGPLNMGDVFSFQLATTMDLPLFFQGKDFLSTPVKNAMALLGYEMTEANLGVPRPLAST